jgi:hypothetical protein
MSQTHNFRWVDKTPPQFRTESYVTCPPALMAVDAVGNIWTLGVQEKMQYFERRVNLDPAGWEFDVRVNDVWTGEWASKITCKQGRIEIFGDYGKSRHKRWTGTQFV